MDCAIFEIFETSRARVQFQSSHHSDELPAVTRVRKNEWKDSATSGDESDLISARAHELASQ